MRVARWMTNINALGPGNRLALWVTGCSRNCPDCIARELQNPESGADIEEGMLAALLLEQMQAGNCTALTVSGGEPLEQITSVAKLLRAMAVPDVLLYTGYTLEEAKLLPGWDELEPLLGAVVTGPYISSQNDGTSLMGSSNQELTVFRSELIPEYDAYVRHDRILQNLWTGNDIVIAGIPKRDTAQILKSELEG